MVSRVTSSRGKRPAKNGHRTGQHAFTGLSVRDWAYLAHSTVIGATLTSPITTGGFTQREPIALYPAVLGKDETVQMFTEVLTMSSLALLVNQHVQLKRSLLHNRLFDMFMMPVR